MTSGPPRRTAPEPPQHRASRTGTTARIDLSALRLNLRAVLSSSGTGIIDVRADAWGHGIRPTARTALECGAEALLVDETGAIALSHSVAPDRLLRAGEGQSTAAVYGLSAGFTPVMSLRSRVLSLKPLRAGEGVSYGYTHRAASDTTVALVAGGYAQGVMRALGNVARVSIDGRRHPVIGRVAMDVCVVDVGSEGRAARGDEVVFFGGGHGDPELREWTDATGLTPAELVTAVGLRAERTYVG